MKKLLSISFCLFLFLSLQAQDEDLKIVLATTNISMDIAQNIGGDYFDIRSIVPIGGDPHLYEAIPSDAQLVNKAVLIIKNGLTLEGWINELIENSGTSAKSMVATVGIKPIQSVAYEGSPDPHAWMSAKNGIIYAENIKNSFVELDPTHKAEFEENFKVYKKKLEDLDAYIRAEVQKIPLKKRVLITSHDAFQYYSLHYGIKAEAILGTSTDAQAQTSDILRVQKVLQETGISAVFIESTVNPKLLKQIASDKNVKIGGELFADSLGDKASGADTYEKMLRYNTNVIVKGLMQKNTVGEDTVDDSISQYIFTGIVALLFIGGFFYMYKKLS